MIVGSNDLFAVVGELVSPLAVLAVQAYTFATEDGSLPKSVKAAVYAVLLVEAVPVRL